MDNTIKALQNLYVALGGTLATVENETTIPAMINAIATLVSAGLTEAMPAVTASDNGEVLTVVEGKWASAEIPAQLPTVDSDDNGKVLKVVEGVWAVGDDATE